MSPVVVVTGAASGIGRTAAELLVQQGWQVVALDRDDLSELVEIYPRVVPVQADLRDPDAVVAARAAAEELGTLTAWVNNAAVVELAPLHEADLDHLDRVLAINLRAAMLGCQQAVRSFLASGLAGSIVNISSIHARAAFPGYAAYDVTKGGLEALTRYMCVEYGPAGIRCNAIAPGAVWTSSSDRLAAASSWPQDERQLTRDLAPMQRYSEPIEIAHAIAYLLSEHAIGINGHVLALDNGMAARSVAADSLALPTLRRPATVPGTA